MTSDIRNNQLVERPDWLEHSVWPHEVKSTQVEGRVIAYTDEGTGPALLLVHDGMWSYVWGQLIEQLKDDFRVLTLDFPGSGLSPDDGSRPSLEEDSNLLEAFVDHQSIQKATPVLHDLGGSVGVGLALRRPDFVEGVVLMNTFAWPPQTPSLRAMFKLMTSRPIRSLNVATNLVPRLTTSSSGIGRHLDDAARSTFLGGFEERRARRRFHDLMAAAREETEFLAELEQGLRTTLSGIPALTIYGEKNDPFGFQATFAGYLSDVEEMVIPGGNHFPMCDDPQGVAATIADWHRRKVSVD